MVEFDVKLTADGALILMHDDGLDRTTDGHGAVAATTLWRDIRAPRCRRLVRRCLARRAGADAWRRPSTSWRKCGLNANIEIKPCPGREVETAAAGGRAACGVLAEGRPCAAALELCPATAWPRRASVAPEIPRGLLLWGKPADWSAAARGSGCASVHCAAERYDARPWAAEIGRLGYGLAVYTVNDACPGAAGCAAGAWIRISDSRYRLLPRPWRGLDAASRRFPEDRIRLTRRAMTA